ncbi:hypothetical protein [Polyangium mundeleinium]|uniref:Uncharacterized protein n=1 Tax=Polyangium mundeleinium TaxID=2995306 RepID=A0ABT5EIN4_9BACT|nr:hypothetical protein [Polyangium mundeleinium]MDC0741675.1 hypothetical protein [Polyangium mundeleinium]
MDSSHQKDPDIAALEQAAAKERRKKLLIAGGVILCVPLYWAMGFSSVRGSLAEEGYTDLHVSPSGLFDWTFEGKKGASTCKGSVTRMPFSSSKNTFCSSVDASGRASGSLDTSSN